jgi:hypothetical protein
MAPARPRPSRRIGVILPAAIQALTAPALTLKCSTICGTDIKTLSLDVFMVLTLYVVQREVNTNLLFHVA